MVTNGFDINVDDDAKNEVDKIRDLAVSCTKECKMLMMNGVCDEKCNIEICFYDAGDCEEEYFHDPDRTKSPTKKPSTKSPTSKSPTPTPTKGQPGYTIELIIDGTMSDPVAAAFRNAKAKWESIIKNDIPNLFLYKKGRKCWEEFTKLDYDKMVDDLLIFARVTYIDGPGWILGQAGPCIKTEEPYLYSRVGMMEFDEDDMQSMVDDGTIDAVILHEMGHIIGIGTLWNRYNLLKRPTANDQNAYYTGSGGIEGQKDIKGSGNPIVETNGGRGTAYSHWDEDTYDNELMTGYAGGSEKLSLLTIKSLKDLRFTVDASKADSFTIPSASRLRGNNKRQYGNDILPIPLEHGEVIPY